MLWTHLSKLSSSPVILLADFAPDAFDSDDLPSSVLPDNGLLKPVVPENLRQMLLLLFSFSTDINKPEELLCLCIFALGIEIGKVKFSIFLCLRQAMIQTLTYRMQTL